MAEEKLAAIFKVGNRFLRSIHLERDFKDPRALKTYILNDHAEECFLRISQGIAKASTQRAWRLTGDYGSGKSSFALFLAHRFAGHKTALSADSTKSPARQMAYMPVLVTASRKSLGESIVGAIYDAMSDRIGRGKKPRLYNEVANLAKTKKAPSDDQVIDLIAAASEWAAKSGKNSGMLLILDELGKNLEYAALNPEGQDIYLLQRIAEVAARSGDSPVIVVALLHQGFSAYADQLSMVGQREWEKVASRFEEIVFAQPIEQVAALVAAALNVDATRLSRKTLSETRERMLTAIGHGWFGAAAPAKALVQKATDLYPIDPFVLPVLVRIFRRFGQNERSLFSFLLSNEPFGLQAFAATHTIASNNLFRLHDLYDYVRFHFGHRLSVQSFRSHWRQIESMIEGFNTQDEIELQIIKTVGILNLLNDGDMLATIDTVVDSVAGGTGGSSTLKNRIRESIGKLQTGRRVLYHRGAAGGICLWPYTSVDLDRVYGKASKSLGEMKTVSDIVEKYVDPQPIVARRHYIQTGNLRFFDIHYCSPDRLQEIGQNATSESDGTILVCLCESKDEQHRARATAREEYFSYRSDVVLAISPPLTALHGAVLEARIWEWIAANTPELATDRFAADEVIRQREASRLSLEGKIDDFLGLRQFSGQMSLEWFRCGNRLRIDSNKEFYAYLSEMCDEIYKDAPRIRNELVNRRAISSAASAARMRLLKGMITNSQDHLLGMDPSKKPPEMSIYLSILKAGGVHIERDDSWHIRIPTKSKDKCNILPSLNRIDTILRKNPDSRTSLEELFEELRRPPFGVLDGLLPILLLIYSKAFESEVAFYEDGTFLSQLQEDDLFRLVKRPESFEVQFCSIGRVRSELLNQFQEILSSGNPNGAETHLLDVVKPMCLFVAKLPEYVRNTARISAHANNVRQAILEAKDPVKLVFHDLPIACEFKPITDNGQAVSTKTEIARKCAREVAASLNELGMAYPRLRERVFNEIKCAFDPPSKNSKDARCHIAQRAESMLVAITEPKMKAFSLRIADTTLPEPEWLESVGSFVASRPPARWTDSDEDLFGQRLPELTEQFKRAESATFGSKGNGGSEGIRLAVTRADGNEKQEVVYVSPDEMIDMQAIQEEVGKILARKGRIGLAAVSQAVWTMLERRKLEEANEEETYS